MIERLSPTPHSPATRAAMVEQELAKLGLDLHRREVGRGRRVLADAYTASEAAGQRFEFHSAITEAA